MRQIGWNETEIWPAEYVIFFNKSLYFGLRSKLYERNQKYSDLLKKITYSAGHISASFRPICLIFGV